MKILFDHQAFGQTFGGVSRYFVETIKHLDPQIKVEISVKFTRNIYLKEILPNIYYPFGKLYLPFKRRLINKANLHYSICSLKDSQYDLFHATFDDFYFLRFLKTPFVISVHDLIPESEPDRWPIGWTESRKVVFPKANHIICNSFFTKIELLKYYPNLNESKISVVYRGYKSEESIQEFSFIPENYILFVGGRKGYKNFERFVQACASLLVKYKELKLFCTGEEFSKEEIYLLNKLKISKQVIQKKVNEYELKGLYKNALIFVFPSIKEGFGLPILEAWGNGCPVVLSNCQPFPEIAGDAAEYFNPENIESIQNSMIRVISSETLRSNLIGKGFMRIKLFTWEKSTKEHERIYHKVLENT